MARGPLHSGRQILKRLNGLASACAATPARLRVNARALQRTQEVQEVLRRGIAEGVEVVDHLVGFRRPELGIAGAAVRTDRMLEIVGATVVQEEDALPKAPLRRGPELV